MSQAPKSGAAGHINYGWAHADQLAAARELNTGFKSGGKEKQHQRGPQKKENRPYDQPQSKQQAARQDRSSSYSESADGKPPPPSQRQFEHLGAFSPTTRVVGSGMSRRINGDAMKAFLARDDKAAAKPSATDKSQATQSALPPARPMQFTTQSTGMGPSAVQPAPVVRGPVTTRAKVTVPAPRSSAPVVNTSTPNGQQKAVPCDQQASKATPQTIASGVQASPAIRPAINLTQVAATDLSDPLAAHHVDQPGVASSVQQPVRPPPNDVLAQLQRRFLGGKAASSSAAVQSTTRKAADPTPPTAFSSTKRESLESSTDSSVIAGLEKLTLEESKDHEASNDTCNRSPADLTTATAEVPSQPPSTPAQKQTLLPKDATSWIQRSTEQGSAAVDVGDPPSTGPAPTNVQLPSSAAVTTAKTDTPPQQTSTPAQKRTLLPKDAAAWLQQPTEQKARTVAPVARAPVLQPPQPTTVSESKETSTPTQVTKQVVETHVTSGVPKENKEKGPGLASSMWACGSALDTLSKGFDPNFNAQAQSLVTSNSGRFSQAQVIVQSSMGIMGYSNNHPYQDPISSLPSSSTASDQAMMRQRNEMPAAPADKDSQPQSSQPNERRGLKHSCWNF